MNKDEIIKLRSEFVPYERAKEIQKQLISIYQKEYVPKHTPQEYWELIKKYSVTEIKERHPQETNWPDAVYECFTCVSQHVLGYTHEHCLDQIFEAVQNKKQRIEEYKKLPTLEELINSETEIHPDKTYKTKEKGSYEDLCCAYNGDVILEMRKIGIEEYRKKFLI